MKVYRFDRNAIRKIFEKMLSLRPKHNVFMSWGKYVFKLLFLIFPLLFLIILFINILIPKTIFIQKKENVLFNQNSRLSHYLLAQEFFYANDFPLATQEFLLSNANTPPLLNSPDKIAKEIIIWKKLVDEIPSYRDAYLKLFILNNKIYKDFDAQNFLKKAKEVDPNNETLKKLSLP